VQLCSGSKVLRTSGGASPAGVGRAPTWRRRRRRTCQLAARESEAAEAAATASKWHVGFRGEGRAMPGQCYRGRQRHDPLQLAPERTERGRHRQPSAGEASKTTPAPLTEPHLIPVCRYVPLLLLGYLSAVYTALQKQRFKMAKYGHYANHDLFLQIRIRIRSGCPVFFFFLQLLFFLLLPLTRGTLALCREPHTHRS
jgi:hypothetical protein